MEHAVTQASKTVWLNVSEPERPWNPVQVPAVVAKATAPTPMVLSSFTFATSGNTARFVDTTDSLLTQALAPRHGLFK